MRRKSRRKAEDLTGAKDQTRTRLRDAAAELERQTVAARQEQHAVIRPLRRLIDVNHFADMLAQQLHQGE